MEHRNHTVAGEQEYEYVAQAEVVIDGADEHKQQGHAEHQPTTGGKDVNAALSKHDRTDFRPLRRKNPVADPVA